MKKEIEWRVDKRHSPAASRCTHIFLLKNCSARAVALAQGSAGRQGSFPMVYLSKGKGRKQQKTTKMLNNHVYNLINQVTQEHKSLWRIKNAYKEDAKDCPVCTAFWEKLEKDKEQHVAELEEMIKKHL